MTQRRVSTCKRTKRGEGARRRKKQAQTSPVRGVTPRQRPSASVDPFRSHEGAGSRDKKRRTKDSAGETIYEGPGNPSPMPAHWAEIPAFLPGIAIFITSLGFNLLGDGLRDAASGRG